MGVALAGSHMAGDGSRPRRVPLDLEQILSAARIAEETGYDVLYVPDHGVWDPFGLLAGVAARTERIALAPGVVTLTGRSVAVLASSARTLDRLSGQRASLGVGSGPERRIGAVRDGLRSLRAELGEGVPIHLAALGPRMTELAGEHADAVLLNWCPPRRVASARDEVARGAERAGRDPAEVTVAVYVRTCLGHEDDIALEALREATAMYAAIPAYRAQLESVGLPPTDLDALVRKLCVHGTRELAVERLDAWREAGADLVVVYPVTAQEPGSSLVGTIMAAAPSTAVEH